jgi:hypothetical protein
VTRLPCDTFGLYIAFVYLQKAVEILLLQWNYGPEGAAAPYLSVAVALLVMVFGYGASLIGMTKLFKPMGRKVIEDYGLPLTVIFFSGFVHIGRMSQIDLEALPVSRALHPTSDRGWIVPFWDTNAEEVFFALPFAVAITILFYFDHNGERISSDGGMYTR